MKMLLCLASLCVGVAVAGLVPAAVSPDAPDMLGFDPAAATAQARLERDFDGGLSAEEARGWMEHLSAAPNHVGSEHNRQNAEFVLGLFRSWGWKAAIEDNETDDAARDSLRRLSPPAYSGLAAALAAKLPARN